MICFLNGQLEVLKSCKNVHVSTCQHVSSILWLRGWGAKPGVLQIVVQLDCKLLEETRAPAGGSYHISYITVTYKIFYNYLLRKPAGRLGVVSPCERSENKEGVWGRGVVDTGAFFGRNRRCLGCRF